MRCLRSLFPATAGLLRITLVLAVCCSAIPTALAGDICARIAQPQAGELAQRIATVACRENALWFAPFIDSQGRLASMSVVEAEDVRLADGTTPAWKRVVDYWTGSGLLGRMAGFAGASDCSYAGNSAYPLPGCRAFVIDRPWSAAFVSWVMVQAGVPDFNPSPSHVDYVRDAYLRPETSPFRFTDPATGKPAAGDLLCFVRGSDSVRGFDGLRAFLSASPGAGLGMHCDIAVAANPGGDGKLYLVGGNVLQGVTMRTLALNRNGLLWALPSGNNAGCGPDNPAMCSFNRQNWAVLLKLKPLQPLPRPLLPAQQYTAPATCCVNCVLGEDVPRCPSPEL